MSLKSCTISCLCQATIKLTKKGASAPQREPVADAQTQKEMMAWYYKKQVGHAPKTVEMRVAQFLTLEIL